MADASLAQAARWPLRPGPRRQPPARALPAGDEEPKRSIAAAPLGELQDRQAAEQIWQRYFERLLPLARSRLKSLSVYIGRGRVLRSASWLPGTYSNVRFAADAT